MSDTRFSVRKKIVLLGLAGVLLVFFAILFFWKSPLKVNIPGVRIFEKPLSIPEFQLVEPSGKPFTRENLLGKWTCLTIGFVYCPDVCPTTLSDMAAGFQRFQEVSGKTGIPQLVFVSVDPYRDTPELLGKYVGYFSPDFLGVTGRPEDVLQLATQLGLHYVFADPEDNSFIKNVLQKPDFDDYMVVHSTAVLFITPRAEVVARMNPPLRTDRVVSLLESLFDYYGDR